MSGTIKFFHPEETFHYTIDKAFCKVVFLKQKNCLILEIESTEDLDHLDEDSLQNEYPKVILNIDDFPVGVKDRKQLAGKTVEIPEGTVDVFDEEEEENIEMFYTNLMVGEDDLEINDNVLNFSQSSKGVLKLHWTGEVADFTDQTDEMLNFEVDCSFTNKKIVIED